MILVVIQKEWELWFSGAMKVFHSRSPSGGGYYTLVKKVVSIHLKSWNFGSLGQFWCGMKARPEARPEKTGKAQSVSGDRDNKP